MNPARRAAHRSAQLAHEYSLFTLADATSPRGCRDFVRAALFTHDREPLGMPAALCTSELVTNVHLHAKGTAMLRIRLSPARLRVSVFDESPDPRRWRMCGGSRTGERGGSLRACGSSWARSNG
ncbi:ATP-binding protein [Streptomyces sp. NPDC096132]|uniref:ATP-binding protein n=1 Tax=Streptomyces sp. NPDC096132 TaxID=3366075 RepID=UPI003801A135